MQREIIKHLLEWKNSQNRKPLILQGARQVGKTWVMKEFGKLHYKNVVYINFDKNEKIKNLFLLDKNIDRIILGLEIENNVKIDTETLIILDEIQECNQALSSLKYFYEDFPKYNVICAGSLLGVSIHSDYSFPVGKVDFLNIYPLTFYEFLKALNEEKLYNTIENNDFELVSIFKEKILEYLKYYFVIGGMPEVVANFIENKDFNKTKEIQKSIINGYIQDFSKHIVINLVPKLNALWNSIPSQLAKEKNKFIYSQIEKGARSKEYENALEWLIKCGLIHRVNNISKPNIPIISYQELSNFKLFLLDVGLLSAMVDLDIRILLEGSKIWTEFKGSLTEQYILQELKTIKDLPVCYWTNKNGNAEIDFIIQNQGEVIPLEVKSAMNLQAKSLKTYIEKFQPNLSIRTSIADFKKNENIFDIPLFMIRNLKTIIGKI